MAMDSLTTGLLQEGHNVKVLTLHTHKHPFLESELTSTYLETTEFEAVFAETELNLRDAFSHVITGESYHLSRFHVPEMERAIEDNLRERVFDVIILESLFTTSYIPAIRRLSDAELVLRAHNVEHQLWLEVSSGMSQGPKKWLLDLFQSKLHDEEVRIMGEVDAVVAITAKDAQWFEHAMASQRQDVEGRVTSVPFGLDVEGRKHDCIQQPPTKVLHLGAMDWTPNVQGVTWLKDEVWPEVHRAMPKQNCCWQAATCRNLGRPNPILGFAFWAKSSVRRTPTTPPVPWSSLFTRARACASNLLKPWPQAGRSSPPPKAWKAWP